MVKTQKEVLSALNCGAYLEEIPSHETAAWQLHGQAKPPELVRKDVCEQLVQKGVIKREQQQHLSSRMIWRKAQPAPSLSDKVQQFLQTHNKPATVQQIAEAIGSNRSSVQKSLTSLRNRNLVERDLHPDGYLWYA